MRTEGRECLKEPKSFCDCLRAEGIDLVFGYPGGAIMPLYDALDGSGVRHILTRHEQGAVFAAEGYARATGKSGVAIATSGPGATNLVTGIADAKMDSVPLVCITGQVRSPLIGTDAFQETDVFGMTLSITKWSRLVRTIEEIPDAIAEGFLLGAQRTSGPGGHRYSDRLLKAKMEFTGPEKFTPHAKPADAKAEPGFSDKAHCLAASPKKPVALIGAGAKLSGAIDELRGLLDHSIFRPLPPCMGWGRSIPKRLITWAWSGMHGTRAANMALHENDLLLVFGARLMIASPAILPGFAPNAKIVHFEIDPAQLDRVRACELPVIGDLAETIPAFHADVKTRFARLDAWRSVACGEPIAPSSIRAACRNRRFAFWTNFSAACRKTALSSPTLASIRCGRRSATTLVRREDLSPPADSAAWASLFPRPSACRLAKPDTTVVCVSGDGGFQMNIQELATVRRLNLPIKLVIIDNKYLGMVRQWQQLFYQRNYAETDLSDNPDFVEIAEAYKIHASALTKTAMREFPVTEKPATRSTLSAFDRTRVAGLRLSARSERLSDGSSRRRAVRNGV